MKVKDWLSLKLPFDSKRCNGLEIKFLNVFDLT